MRVIFVNSSFENLVSESQIEKELESLFDQWPKLYSGLNAKLEIKTLNGLYYACTPVGVKRKIVLPTKTDTPMV